MEESGEGTVIGKVQEGLGGARTGIGVCGGMEEAGCGVVLGIGVVRA